MGKKRIYELAKEMNKASKDVVDKAHQLGMDVKNHMGAISSEQETKLRQAFGGGSTVNTQSKATNNQKQQTTQNKPANKKPMNNKPGEQRNNQNRPNNQSTNGQQRNNNNQNRHGQSNTQNRSNQTNTNNQNRNTQNNNGSTTNQNRTSQNNNGGNNQNRGGQNRNNNFGGGQNRNNRNNFNNQNRNRFNKKGKKGKHQQESAKPAVPARKFRELPDVLEYTEGMNVADIAKKIHREPAEIIKKLFMMGVMVNQNQALDKDTIELLAVDYGMEPQEKVQVDIADIDKFFEPEAVVEENLTTRPPVVTIMGHVDHGKTTLLDTLRHSRVTSGEAGGITQHIGAYQLDIDGKPITFLDTPGHAAFTSMRARGASITDITILVVAADDGVMPQTIEAINHAKAAKVPIIVAVNKIDKPGANPDPIVVGNTYGRVRVMTNDMGRRDKEAGPATPVEITGLNDVPQAGDRFVVFEDEKTARQAGEERAKRALLEQRSASSRVTLDNLFESLKEGELKEVNIIVKADVQGSAEAVSASLQKIDVEGVRVKIVHAAVGAINESDVTLAAASNAIIIGFNVRPTPQAKQQAEQEEVDIRLHRIIYKALEEIETAMKGLLDPEFEEKITGQMTVRELYKVSKVGTIAGCYVTEGFIRRDSGVRVIRDGIVIYEGKLASLKRFKDDVKEVKLGFECGAMIENFNDLRVDDAIEGFIMEEIKQ